MFQLWAASESYMWACSKNDVSLQDMLLRTHAHIWTESSNNTGYDESLSKIEVCEYACLQNVDKNF